MSAKRDIRDPAYQLRLRAPRFGGLQTRRSLRSERRRIAHAGYDCFASLGMTFSSSGALEKGNATKPYEGEAQSRRAGAGLLGDVPVAANRRDRRPRGL